MAMHEHVVVAIIQNIIIHSFKKKKYFQCRLFDLIILLTVSLGNDVLKQELSIANQIFHFFFLDFDFSI